MTNTSATGTRAQEDRQRPDRRSLYGLVFLAGIDPWQPRCAPAPFGPPLRLFHRSVDNITNSILVGLSGGLHPGWSFGRSPPNPTDPGSGCDCGGGPHRYHPVRGAAVAPRHSAGVGAGFSGAVIGSFFGSALLFVPPVVLLGMVEPTGRAAGHNQRGPGEGARSEGFTLSLPTIGSPAGYLPPVPDAIPRSARNAPAGTAALIAASGALLHGARYWA